MRALINAVVDRHRGTHQAKVRTTHEGLPHDRCDQQYQRRPPRVDRHTLDQVVRRSGGGSVIPLLVVTIVAMVMAAGFCIGMFRRDNSVLGLMALGMALAAGFTA